MERLPLEMYLEIFSLLNLKDVLTCKLVSKRWYQIVNYLKVNRLVVSARLNGYPYPYPNEVQPALFSAQFDKRILERLKYLKIAFDDKLCKFELTKLSRFQQLIELEIDCSPTGSHTLSLPSLRRFALVQYNYFASLSIEAPRLTSLCYHGPAHLLDLKHSESVTSLCAHFYGSALEPFQNVEYLEGSSAGILITDTLSILPKLKRLAFANRFESIYESFEFGIENYDQIKSLLGRLLRQRRALGKHQLKIFFVGLELVDGKAIDEYGFEMNEEQFYLKNYPLLAENCNFIFKVNYTNLMAAGRLPTNYFAKFANLQSVETSGRIADPDHFFWFLKQINRQLAVLSLKNSGLDQAGFFDQLPAICGSLTNLQIKEDDEEPQLDYTFLAELDQLNLLRISQTLDLPSTRSLLKSFRVLKQLISLELRFNRVMFNIWKKHSNHTLYNLTCNNVKNWNLSFDQLIRYFERLGAKSMLNRSRGLALQFSCHGI